MPRKYPLLPRREFIKFIKKLNFELSKKRGKGSHEVYTHKKYLTLTVPTNSEDADKYWWDNLEKSIGHDPEWITKKLKQHKIIK